MNDREQAINQLKQALSEMHEAYQIVLAENKESQFDYVTSSKLANIVCDLDVLLNKINKIVFQK